MKTFYCIHQLVHISDFLYLYRNHKPDKHAQQYGRKYNVTNSEIFITFNVIIQLTPNETYRESDMSL